MTENEAIKELETSIDLAKMCTQNAERKKEIEAYNMAIQALSEIQQYRAIGTVEEFKALKDAYIRGANRGVDKFANFLHKKAKENNGLYLSSETRSRTHPCIFNYVQEFKAEEICKEET